jgi:hypothetical protein
MKNVGTSVKVFLAAKMRCAVVFTLISLTLVPQAFAVLRPLFPAKPAPPFNGELIIIRDDLVLKACKRNAGKFGINWDNQMKGRTNPNIKAHLT